MNGVLMENVQHHVEVVIKENTDIVTTQHQHMEVLNVMEVTTTIQPAIPITVQVSIHSAIFKCSYHSRWEVREGLVRIFPTSHHLKSHYILMTLFQVNSEYFTSTYWVYFEDKLVNLTHSASS